MHGSGDLHNGYPIGHRHFLMCAVEVTDDYARGRVMKCACSRLYGRGFVEGGGSVANIREAVKRVKQHTMPGQDGVPADVWHESASEDKLMEHLREVYTHIMRKGEMNQNMRETVTTMTYKGKGDAEDPARYRPICVTAVIYRILATAMAQKLVGRGDLTVTGCGFAFDCAPLNVALEVSHE